MIVVAMSAEARANTQEQFSGAECISSLGGVNADSGWFLNLIPILRATTYLYDACRGCQ